MKEFRHLEPSCYYNNDDTIKILKSLGLNDVVLKSNLSPGAFTGDYDDLNNCPDVVKLLTNIIKKVENIEDATFYVSPQSDWNESDINSASYIRHKPENLSQFNNDTNFITENGVDSKLQQFEEQIDEELENFESGVNSQIEGFREEINSFETQVNSDFNSLKRDTKDAVALQKMIERNPQLSQNITDLTNAVKIEGGANIVVMNEQDYRTIQEAYEAEDPTDEQQQIITRSEGIIYFVEE